MTLTLDRIDRKFYTNPDRSDVPTTADVAVIGGGIAGPAASWALDRLSPGIKTVLIEKGSQLASGASTASIENFRSAWPTECLARMMTRSINVLLNADEYLGEGAESALNVRQRGYLYCGFNDEDAKDLQASVAQLNNIGLPHVEYLEADEVAYRYPWLKGRVVAAKFDPMAGWIDSNALANAYAKMAESAKFLLEMENTEIIVENSKVVGVKTSGGVISTSNVVIAAGPGSRQIANTAGIDIPIVVRPRQSFTTKWRHEDFPGDSPFIIGAHPSSYVRPEAQDGAIFGWEYKIKTEHGAENAEDFMEYPDGHADEHKDARFPSLTLNGLAKQFSYEDSEGFNDTKYMAGLTHRAGYYVYRHPETTYKSDSKTGERKNYDSERAIIDACPGIDGLFLSVAHVGHGIMSSPAAAEILAAHVLGQEMPDPLFLQFGINVPYVENDGGGL